ncbi:MAG: hypothetical protein IT384_09900 [Deltaproteobacteria bacterium]|nr:hypothetical protein [Deltaproteobacteria bacterium]
MISRSFLVVIALCSNACGPSTAEVIVDPIGPDLCRRHCVETLEVTLDGRSTRMPCGEPISLGTVEAGARLTLAIRAEGTGFTLRGEIEAVAARGEALEISVALEPEDRPRISAVIPERPVLFGATEIAIEGAGFGSGERSEVKIGEETLEVLEWAPERIRARTETVGPLTVLRCGIASATVAAGLTEVVVEAVEPLPSSCAEGRLVAADVRLSASAGDGIVGLFDCAASVCSEGLIGRLEPRRPRLEDYWGPMQRCAINIAAFDAPDLLLATDRGLGECRQLANHRVDCTPRETAPGTIVGLTSLRQAAIAAYAISAPSGERTLYLSTSTSTSRLLDGVLGEVRQIDGRFVLGRTARGDPALFQWGPPSNPALLWESPLPSCAEPRRLVVGRPVAAAAARLAVACEDGADTTVLGFDLARSDQPLSVTRLAQLSADGLAVTVDGAVALVWSSGGELVFVDVSGGRELGRRGLAPGPEGGVLVRAPFSDRFALSGPAPGQVIWIDAEPRR